MNKEVVVNEGENDYLSWGEILEENDKYITYTEWGVGKDINIDGSDDITYIAKIEKKDLRNFNFETLLFVLKNLSTELKFNKFCSFLKRKDIKFEEQIW